MLQSLFPPGQSPFRVKGVAYRGHIEFIERNVPGGLLAQNAAFDDKALALYFEQPFVAGGWYDVFPLAEAGVVCARLRNEPLHQLLKVRAKDQVTRDLGSVYGFLARFVSQRLIARGVVDATERYFDFLSTVSEQVAPGHVRATVTGLPEALSDWMTVLMQSYAEATFEHVGQIQVNVRMERAVRSGSRHGMPAVTTSMDIRWVE